MNPLNGYKDKHLVYKLSGKIRDLNPDSVNFMEVCGGHTHAIQKYGIGNLLPETINLISGPGCPVCVTETSFIDKALKYAENPGHIIATYGDLIRVPGTKGNLEMVRSHNQNVVIIHSPLEILDLARDHTDKKIIFLAIGFETTAPGTALLVKKVLGTNIDNVYILSAHKVMPPAMEFLLEDKDVKIDGFIAPGHVSAITGSDMYKPLMEKYKVPVAIAGFEPVDLLQSVYMLTKQKIEHSPKVEIQYNRAVSEAGNIKAMALVDEFFEKKPASWRGLGELNDSGLQLKKKYSTFDIEKEFPVTVQSHDPKGCICGKILKGINKPFDCKLFAKTCNPTNPVGACMVSPEGACQAYYAYAIHE